MGGPLRVALHGAGGRMGRMLAAAILEAPDLALVQATDRQDHPDRGRDLGTLAGRDPCGVPLDILGPDAAAGVDVFLDFSLPEGTEALLGVAGALPLVVGTTGLGHGVAAALAAHAERAPVVLAPNFSTGVTVLRALVALAARFLPGWDAEIVEVHHRRKVDAPSGTALALAGDVAAARGDALEARGVYGRQGVVGPRPAGEIGIHAVRAGDVVGEHRVLLAGPGERLELVHAAGSREAFVAGALAAVRWIGGRPPGRYGMAEVLGLGG